jgi:hypothetical protein
LKRVEKCIVEPYYIFPAAIVGAEMNIRTVSSPKASAASE